MSKPHNPIVAPARRPVLTDAPPSIAPACAGCGATLAPSGACLELGACASADAAASRQSRTGATAKYVAAPAAWNGGGRVD